MSVGRQPKEPPQGPAPSGRSGDNYGERLAKIEARMEYLATKEDIAKVETKIADVGTLIERRLNSLVYSLFGVLAVIVVGVAIVF